MDHLLSESPSGSPPVSRGLRPHRWVLCALVAVALAGCGGDGGTTPPPPPPPPADPNSVSMVDNSFNPATRTVSAGTTVRWVNNGTVVHNTISDTGVWTSGSMNPGADFQHTFSTAGSFAYRCTFHAGMAGTIVVQ